MFELIEDHGELLVEAQPGLRALRYGHPVYAAYRAHVVSLLDELVGEIQAGYLADVLLAGLAPDFVLYQRRFLGLSRSELEAGWSALVRSLG